MPILRVLLSVELLRRMGFQAEADRYLRAWTTIYSGPPEGALPKEVLHTAPRAIPLVVDVLCYRPFAEIGNKTLAEVYRFGQNVQWMIEECAGRIAAGTDPGIVPAAVLDRCGAVRAGQPDGRRERHPRRFLSGTVEEMSRADRTSTRRCA